MHLEPFFRPYESALERLAHFGFRHVGPAPEPVRRPLVVVPDFDGYSQSGEDWEDGRFVAVEREIFCETTQTEVNQGPLLVFVGLSSERIEGRTRLRNRRA